MKSNNQIHSLIKLRHLKKASQNNWAILNNTQEMVNRIISEAQFLVDSYGNSDAKAHYLSDSELLDSNIAKIQESLNDFQQFIQGSKLIDLENSFQRFNATLEETTQHFDSIASYPESYFDGIMANEWSEIWEVIKSNMSIVQGVGESAYIKSLMIANFSKSEVDELTREVVTHMPESFNLLEADKYKEEYFQAVKEIEQESNAKDNLWDRFLNVLAGNVPFKQSPQERVMMRRWLDGDRGQL